MAEPAIASMTGFGRGTAENRHAAVSVELRSVNGKGLVLKLRLPGERMELEPKLEAQVRKRIERGSVQGQLRITVAGSAAAEPDLAVLARYRDAWKKGVKELGLEPAPPTMAELLALPGAFQAKAEDEKVTRAVAQACSQAMGAALDALVASRGSEGGRLGKELERMLKKLESQLKQAMRREPQAKKEAARRLQERVDRALEVMPETDAGRIDLTRELALLGERADIQEELARLEIHLERFRGKLAAGGAVGRELEFLLQEIHREVTTLGNKSADERLSELVVAMKLVVQQLKEQLANVE
ncbi:MAG: YicC/YloC family endoribonuclease [Planctomycetota bacterium]|jgi:uncharacterized protein (TIGR00255 family)